MHHYHGVISTRSPVCIIQAPNLCINMIMVSGISISPERMPAVAVPPAVMAQIARTAAVATDLKPVQPYAAAVAVAARK